MCVSLGVVLFVWMFSEVREVFAQVLSDFGISYTRVPVETGLHSCPFLPPHLRDFYLQVEKDARQSVEVFHRHGIRCATKMHNVTTQSCFVMNKKQETLDL